MSPAPTSTDILSANLKQQVGHVLFVILPLSLIVGIVTADQYNLDFVRLVQLGFAAQLDRHALPSDDALRVNPLRWTFLQSAYWLPMVLFTGAMLVLLFVLLVAKLRPARLVDGLVAILVLIAGMVALMTLLNAFVGTSVVGVLFTKMAAGFAICSTLGLVAQAVELFPSAPGRGSLSGSTPASHQDTLGFSSVTFAAIYGLGTAFGSSASLSGYQIASLLQRHGVSFSGVPNSGRQGFLSLFVVEGCFFFALCPAIGVLLILARRFGRRPSAIDSDASTKSNIPAAGSATMQTDAKDVERAQISPVEALTASSDVPSTSPASTSVEDKRDPGSSEKTTLAGLRRLSSYYPSLLASINIFRRNANGEDANNPSAVVANLRSLQQMHTGFGLWVSSVLRRIMVFLFGGLGVDDAAFDLISAGTSSRETFIAGVLIVSNTSVIQAAVIWLVVKTQSHASKLESASGSAIKLVPVVPGLPTLAGGVSGAVSAIAWSILATKRPAVRKGWRKRLAGRMETPWWVPALLTTCLGVSIVGLVLAVLGNSMVPDGSCGSWILYVATIVTFAGTVPQLPLALLQIYTVLDVELGRSHPTDGTPAMSKEEQVQTAPYRAANILGSNSEPSVHALRWERVGVMISTLTTTVSSTLLTAWIFMLSDTCQTVFLFVSVVLAVGGSVWLMLRHTLPWRRQGKVEQQAASALAQP
ncbi:hypothetical protein PHSY_005621 [Pseudozyma hubeiensis SY62]|uniref:Uncharacterized protein n=1 Tax=Pseudozyma hubeiensis (strain SY62) TaxID=1305764 RepID=R9P9G6_PSEHS|nr:hypothetical protein PHSY_005621 [Pseudozyma hubeiensis SY62]GAC98033.1 hypothetical protein PHSY_005621 [Pseudozyma hubeiensis SY62]